MKKLFPVIIASLMAASATATIHTIQVGNFQFTPTTLPNVHVGDTVQWVWTNGFHTTTSTTIPSGAAAWDEAMTAAKTFNYKVTTGGAYNYKCTPHEGMGMVGTFTASSSSTGVNITANATLFNMYPNPAANNLRLVVRDAGQQVTISITDALGKTISSRNYSGSAIDISTAALANGIYTIRAVVGREAYSQSFEVAH